MVQVVRLDRGQVRLGIECPKDIPIMRSELIEADRVDDAVQAATEVAKKQV